MTKAELYEKKPNTHNLFLASDKDVDKANKVFMAFETPASLLKLLNQSRASDIVSNQTKSHFYEIIPDMQNHPVFVFFDLDRVLVKNSPVDAAIIDNYDNYLIELYNTFITVFERFLHDIYELSDLKPTYQVSYTPNTNKVSLHIKIDIRCANLQVLKEFAKKFCNYVTSNAYLTTIERSYFSFYGVDNQGNKLDKTLIDHGVYTNFRCLRILYSSKFKTNSICSQPFLNSSKDINDHLVLCSMYQNERCLPTQCFTFTAESVQDHIGISLDHSKRNNLSHLPFATAPVLSDPEYVPTRPSHFPTAELDHISRLITSHPGIPNIFNQTVELASPIALDTNIWRYTITNSSKCICPYAKRCHHSNHMQFDYFAVKGFVRVSCFNEDCKAKMKKNWIHFPISTDSLGFLTFAQRNSHHSLHCADSIIDWDEEYDSETMMPYPLKPLVCIKAGMGVGKTKLLTTDFITQFASAPDTKCLFITYQILLSKKYINALFKFGFVNYLDVERDIHENKIIVCLDSIHRIKTSHFDFIFIDEALSVLLHFNSHLMNNVSTVCTIFDSLICQAKHIYLLDACVDNTLIYNFVSYLSHEKHIKPHWTKNTHIRVSNRQCTAYVNKASSGKKCLEMEAIERVCSLLLEGKKVVVSSSTKTFTNAVELTIKQRFQDKFKYIVYNGDSSKNEIAEHAQNIHEVWSQQDLIVYSPTIGAGLSFEEQHFDVLVGFFANSSHTASVDFCLQQLFRVRQLTEGTMILYINDLPNSKNKDDEPDVIYDGAEPPIEQSEIDQWLDKHISAIDKYFALSTDYHFDKVSSALKYDRDKLSYKILSGIISTKHKSRGYFVDILLKTLQSDYNISCTKIPYEPRDDNIKKKSLALCEEIKDIKKKREIDFDPATCNIGLKEYEELKKRASLEPIETLQKWVYTMSKIKWRIPGQVDAKFFDKYIGQYTESNVKKAFESFYQACRTNDFLNQPLDKTKAEYKNKINKIRYSSDEYNIELFKNKTSRYYNRLIEGQSLLIAIGISPDDFQNTDRVIIESRVLEEKLKNYVGSISDAKFDSMVNMFDMKKKAYGNRGKTIESSKKLNAFAKQVLNVCFNMELGTESRGVRNPKLKRYDNPTRFISIESFNSIKSVYNPSCFKQSYYPAQYSFVDEEED
jgi:hypothetical protein